MTINVDQLRAAEFDWMNGGDTIYMNAASTGPSPKRSVDAQCDFIRRRSAPHLVTFEAQFGTLDRCRALVAEMVGAQTSEIAMAANTGSGINLAAWGYPLGAGDVVVVSDAEFPANIYPWLAAAEARGYTVLRVPTRNGLLDEDAFVEALAKPGVKAASVSWAGFSTGYVADLDRLGEACRSRGILFVVDAIQALGPVMIDVSGSPIDMLACGAQKWLLSPWGSGFTYVRRDVIERLTPQPVSWMAVRGADDFTKLIDYDLAWRDSARRFEQVTLAYQDFAGMAASLELMKELGFGNVAQHANHAALALLDGARSHGVECVTPMDRCGGIASVRPKEPAHVSDRLTASGVVHSLREGVIRLAPHIYTTHEDVERTIALLGSG